MRTQKLLLCGVVVATKVCASAQGTFENLDFEQAKIIVNDPPALIATTNAFPGWAVFGVGGVALGEVQRDSVLEVGAGINDGGDGLPPLEGKFSAMLAGSSLGGVGASIAQSGTIPAGSESLTFLASGGLFSVSFAGHPIAYQPLGNGPRFGEVWGANISAYAGQYGQLTFQAGLGGIYELDDISFSTQAIPEPGVLSILGTGALTLLLLRTGRRARRAAVQPGGCPPRAGWLRPGGEPTVRNTSKANRTPARATTGCGSARTPSARQITRTRRLAPSRTQMRRASQPCPTLTTLICGSPARILRSAPGTQESYDTFRPSAIHS